METTIDTPHEIAAIFANFEPDGDGAFSTCRCLPGQYDQSNCQEWAERGHAVTNEVKHPVTVYWIFENSECATGDGDDIPFDLDHIDRIVIEEAE